MKLNFPFKKIEFNLFNLQKQMIDKSGFTKRTEGIKENILRKAKKQYKRIII